MIVHSDVHQKVLSNFGLRGVSGGLCECRALPVVHFTDHSSILPSSIPDISKLNTCINIIYHVHTDLLDRINDR